MTNAALPLMLLVAAIFLPIDANLRGKNKYTKTHVKLVDLSASTIPYETAWNWQKKLLDHHVELQDKQQLQQQPIAGHVLLLQHKSVYTLGSATTVSAYTWFDIFTINICHHNTLPLCKLYL